MARYFSLKSAINYLIMIVIFLEITGWEVALSFRISPDMTAKRHIFQMLRIDDTLFVRLITFFQSL
jgi:hypothetical protein